MKALYVVGAIVLAVGLFSLYQALPDIQRYLKIRSM